MVESDHGESAEDVMTSVKSGGVDADAKKVDLVGKRQREDSSEDEKCELPSKRPRSEIKELPGEAENDLEEPVRKANGSAAMKEDTMEVDGQDGLRKNSKAPLSNSDEKTDEDDSSVPDEKEDESNAQNDTTVNKDKPEQKKDNTENDVEQQGDSEKKDASSEDKEDADDDDEVDEEKADSSIEEKASDDKTGKPSVSKSRTKDPEVVDGLEMSVECASDKEASSSDGEKDDEKTTKSRPKTIIVKAKPNDSELEVSGSGSEKSDDDEEEDEKEEKGSKKSKASAKSEKGSPERKRGRKKKTFSKPMSSESEEKSSDDASDDEDYSPRTKKKMKKGTPAKKSMAKTPATGKRRGRAPKKPAKKSEDEQSDEEEVEEEEDVNLAQRSQKSKDKAQKKNSESEDEEKSEEEQSDTGRKSTKRSKARPEDDKRIQALKKYLHLAGITVPNYEKFWSGCKTNTARVARLKEKLAEHGVTGRPTIEKCKKAKARMEMRKDVDSLDQSAVIDEVIEGRVTRARGGAANKKPTTKGESSPRRESRKRVLSVVDSDSE